MTPEQAFDQHHQAVYRFVYRLTRRTDVAEDVTQECFLAYLKAPGRFNPQRSTARTYLLGIARNLVWKHFRSSSTESLMEEDFPHPQGSGVPVEELLSVECAVAALPRLQQEALILFEYEGCSLEEIAAIAGVDQGTIKSRLHRAREALKRVLVKPRRVNVHGST